MIRLPALFVGAALALSAITVSQSAVQAAEPLPPCADSYSDLHAVDDNLVVVPGVGTSASIDVLANDAHPEVDEIIGSPRVDLVLADFGPGWWTGSAAQLPDPFDSLNWPHALMGDFARLPDGMTARVEKTSVKLSVAKDYVGPTTVLINYSVSDWLNQCGSRASGRLPRTTYGTLAVSTTGSFKALGTSTVSATAVAYEPGVATRRATVERGTVHRTATLQIPGHRTVVGHGTASVLTTASASAERWREASARRLVTRTASCRAERYEAAQICAEARAGEAALAAANHAASTAAMRAAGANATAAANRAAFDKATARARSADPSRARARAAKQADRMARRDARNKARNATS